MLTVHHLENSRSQRIVWLLEELGVPYELRRYARDPRTMLAPPELRALHPLGKSPLVTDGDRVLAESGAIVEGLLDRYGDGRLRPAAGTPERERFTYWLHYAEGSAMPPLLLALIFRKVATSPAPFFVRPVLKGVARKVHAAFIGPQLELHFGFVEAELGRSAWFAGEAFTAADIQMSYPLEAVLTRGGGAERYPRIAALVERMHARSAYVRARERAGAFELLG